MSKSDEIKELKEKIDSDIESVGGIEGFNNYCCANEVITSWIDRILDIIETKDNKLDKIKKKLQELIKDIKELEE